MHWAILLVGIIIIVIYMIVARHHRHRERKFQEYRKARTNELINLYSEDAIVLVNVITKLIKAYKQTSSPPDIITYLGEEHVKDVTATDTIQSKLKYQERYIESLPNGCNIAVLDYKQEKSPIRKKYTSRTTNI